MKVGAVTTMQKFWFQMHLQFSLSYTTGICEIRASVLGASLGNDCINSSFSEASVLWRYAYAVSSAWDHFLAAWLGYGSG